MLGRFAVILATIVASMFLVPPPTANADVLLPTCKTSGGKSARGPNLSLWKIKKCNPGGTGGGSGGGGGKSSDSTPKKRWCPIVVVRLPDGSCPGPGPNRLPQPVHTFSPIVPIEESVVAALTLPEATPRFGPDPSVNEWNMLVVGFPIWLWTDGPRQQTTHVRRGGLEFAITATWQSSRFTMGDGQVKTCGAMTEYRQGVDVPGRPSPTCGYVYEVVSPKGRPFVVVAEQTWRIDWSSDGDQGSFLHTYQGSRTLEIGELSSLIKG